MRAVLTSEFEWCREALVGDSGEKLGVQAIFSGGVINHWWEGIGKCELGFDSRSGQCGEHSGGKKVPAGYTDLGLSQGKSSEVHSPERGL